MSFKTITRVAAGSVVLGAVVLAPSVAQAKAAPAFIGSSFTMSACPGVGLTANGSGTYDSATHRYTVVLNGAAKNNQYDLRMRYSYVPAGSTTPSIGRARDVVV